MGGSMRAIAVFIVVAMFVFSGCRTVNTTTDKDDPSKAKFEALNQTFYGFPDVPVPKELKFDKNKSFIYETQTLRVGVLVLSGNVDLDSLENYFKVNMAKNGWRFVNSFKFKDVTLNFVKEDKTCNIKMSRDVFSSTVEIWVGPADRTSSDRIGGQRGFETAPRGYESTTKGHESR
jgi:hypothetical protein